MRPIQILLPDGSPAEYITDVIRPAPITSFVGGGGKTSSMLAIGTELAEQGNRVILTTTTHIRPFSEPLVRGLSCVGQPAENGKLGPVSDPDGLKMQCEYLLIEADGSRGMPVKAPAGHEPVLTAGTELVIAVLGLTGIGRPISAVCHRPERVCALLGVSPDAAVTPERAAALILSRDGLRKHTDGRRFAVLLNQADGAKEQEAGRRIASLLPRGIACVMTSYREVDG